MCKCVKPRRTRDCWMNACMLEGSEQQSCHKSLIPCCPKGAFKWLIDFLNNEKQIKEFKWREPHTCGWLIEHSTGRRWSALWICHICIVIKWEVEIIPSRPFIITSSSSPFCVPNWQEFYDFSWETLRNFFVGTCHSVVSISNRFHELLMGNEAIRRLSSTAAIWKRPLEGFH